MPSTERAGTPPSFVTALLDLARDGDRFEAPPRGWGGTRLFGGQVAAQALAAAAATVEPGRLPHVLHASFLRAGRSARPVRYDVERTRDGRSFSTRRVVAAQDRVVFEMTTSFHVPEPGTDWHPPAPIAPRPVDLASLPPWPEAPSTGFFEIRPVVPTTAPFSPPPYWIRSREPVGGDPVTRACVLAFVSDMGVVAAARPPGPNMATDAVSLNHAVWFHRPFAADEWHLFSAGPTSSRSGLGLACGTFHHEDGTLVATIVQEALFRRAR